MPRSPYRYLVLAVFLSILCLAMVSLHYLEESNGVVISVAWSAENIAPPSKLYVQVIGFAPNPPYERIVYRGFVEPNGKLVLDPEQNSVLKQIAREWLEAYPSIDVHANLLVYVMYKQGNILHELEKPVMLSYSPREVLRGGRIEHVVSVNPWVMKTTSLENIRSASVASKAVIPPLQPMDYWYEYRLRNDLSWQAEDYIETPVLVIDNREGPTVIDAGIWITASHYTGLGLTLTTGYHIYDKLESGSRPDVTISLIEPSEGEKARFNQGPKDPIPPGEAVYVYIMGKPANLYYEVYYCEFGECYYLRDEIHTFLAEYKKVVVNGEIEIVGGVGNGLPSSMVMDPDALRFEKVDTLDAGRVLYLYTLLESYTYDTCGVEVEAPFPVGDMAAFFLASRYPFLANLFSGLTAAISYTDTDVIQIDGHIKNLGYEPGYGGSDVPVDVYVSVSSYQYGINCKYNIPVTFYFKILPASR